ncbi:hypothetical protein ACKKBG_A14745 [Auxenochlorella protothecoides x Auxenochlorella symbiontica]
MPELRLFNRRWHISTDVLPLLGAFLAVCHVVYFVPILAGAWTVESTGIQYSCNVGTQLRVAVYSLLGLFALSVIVEFSLTSIGLKGGPLEERKRKPIHVLLYMEVALWLTLVVFTAYGTYILASPKVPTSCWDNNPCAYSTEIPAACTGALNAEGVATLSNACQLVVSNMNDFQSCYLEWFTMGIEYTVTSFPNYTYDWDCDANHNFTAEQYSHFLVEAEFGGNVTAYNEAVNSSTDDGNDDSDDADDCTASPRSGSAADIASYNARLKRCGKLAFLLEESFVQMLGIPYDNSSLSTTVPWSPCQNQTCQTLLMAGDECTEWDVLFKLGNPSSRKGFVIGLVWGSWAMLAVTALSVYIAFNSFPDYEDVEGWEGSLKSISRLCCCTALMQQTALDGSDATAQREIALSLKMLFGGIDLDPTDRFLAAFLVSEAQHRQRRRHATAMLEATGLVPAPRSRNRLLGWLGAGGGVRRGRLGGIGPDAVAGGVGAEAVARLPSAGCLGNGDAGMPGLCGGAEKEGAGAPLLPMYRHSILRMDEGDEEEGGCGGAGSDCGSASASGGSPDGGASDAAAPLRPRLRLHATHRYHPMLTPVGLPRHVTRSVGLRAAAAVYTGAQRPVERAVLERARLVSRFAVGAYALQGVVWNRGVRPPACMGNLNMLVKCLRGPLRLEPALRRRNLEAMLGVAGIARGDLLHVSYANAQGGALPYAIALHRESRSVVLALRGTVTMEDLITDLLSAPIDVSEWLPDWVLDANEGGKPLYAHAGIVSSATAVLQDLDEHGLLKELLLARLEHAAGTPADDITEERGACTGPAAQRMSRYASAGPAQARGAGAPSPPAREEDEASWASSGARGGRSGAEPPPLSVARAILRSKRGWRVVVTGHSLGAAVACMLSFQLRDQFPDLECWAFNPPGGLLSWNLSRLARRFCTSVVVGKDVISRLSFSNMKRVVDEMVLSLARCRRPKLKVVGDLLLKRRGGGRREPPQTSCPVHELSDEVLRRLEKYHATSHLHAASQPELYPPGRLIFLRPFKGQGVAHTWDAVWVDAATLMGEGILLAPSMLAHHRMFTLADAFAEVLREGHEAALEELSTDPDTPC